MNANTKTDMNAKYESYAPECLMNTSGTFRMPSATMNGNTRLLVRWNVAWIFSFSGNRERQTAGSIFLAVSIAPLVQRNCCDFSALISEGSSAGEVTSFRYLNFHPRSWAR